MRWHALLAVGLLAVALMATPAAAIPFDVMIDISPDGGQLEAGAVAISETATPAANANGFNLPATAMTTPGGDPFSLAISNLNAAGAASGGIDWRDRGNAGTAFLTRLGEDFVKNNTGIIRLTLAGLPADRYYVTSYHVDADNTQCEAIKVLVSDATTVGFVDTGARGNALVGSGGVGALTTAKMEASSAFFALTANGVDPVAILLDGSAASDKEVPVNGLWIRSAASAHVYTPLGTGKSFLEQAGQAVIEAENFTARTPNPTGTSWVIKPTENSGTSGADGGPGVANARGGEYLQTLPDLSVGSGGYLNPPSATYQVQISTPGTYRLFLRWECNTADAGGSDSFFADVVELKDGTGGSIADWYEFQHAVDGNFATVPWDGTGGNEQNGAGITGTNAVWTFPTPGIYTVRLTERETGVAVDALILQLSTLAAPTDPGPAQSSFSDATPVLSRYSKLGGDPDALHPLGIAGGLVEGAPAFVDASGNWTSIPDVLLGADYIRTENDDRLYSLVDYSLISDQGAYLYMFLDDEYIAASGMPLWMLDIGFVPTSFHVLLDGQPYTIFQADLPAGEPVSLYGLQQAPGFYGIAVSAEQLVPEPGTLALLGLGGLALLRRRRRASRRTPRLTPHTGGHEVRERGKAWGWTWTALLAACLACLLASGQAQASLVAYWPLDGNAIDAAGGNNGTVNGAVPAPDRNGTPSGALAFNGTSSDYVSVPDSASIGASVRDSITLSTWIYSNVALSTNGNTYRPLEKGDAYFFLQGDGGASLGTGAMNFLIKQNNNNRVVALNEALAANTWYHLAGTFNGATKELNIYLDGGLKRTVIVPDAQIDDDHLALRIGSDDAGKYFNGRMDDVAIYNHVLSPYQIIALAHGASPASLPATPPPVINSVVRSNPDPTAPEEPQVMNGALAENALAYTDRTHEWNGFPAARPELIGADYIKVTNDDKANANLRLKIDLATAATVYLFVDSRAAANVRSWMPAYGFQNTGQTIWMDDNGDGSNNTACWVYRANFPAGKVDLFESVSGTSYGIAAVAGQLAASAHVYTPLGTGKTFLEQSGQAVIEAENYTSRATEGTHDWLVVPDESAGAGTTVNARGGKFVQSMPDILVGGSPAQPPSIEYQVQISTPGTYRAYLRWDGNGTNGTTQGQSDSIYVDIKEIKDGVGSGAADWYELSHTVNGDFNSDPWDGTGGAEQNQATPSDNPITWSFPIPGIYTIRVSVREDASTVDALILQLSSLATPANPGPAQSEFSNATPVLSRYSKLGGDPDALHPLGIAGGLVEGAPAFVDATGNWTSIPDVLLGADYIRTENDDANYSFADYSLISDQGAYLYMFLDDQYVAASGMPLWMLDVGFVPTSFHVLLGGQPFTIFQADLPAGEPVSLYGLQDASSFYGIAVSAEQLVPEPATFALVGLGLLALARRRRR